MRNEMFDEEPVMPENITIKEHEVKPKGPSLFARLKDKVYNLKNSNNIFVEAWNDNINGLKGRDGYQNTIRALGWLVGSVIFSLIVIALIREPYYSSFVLRSVKEILLWLSAWWLVTLFTIHIMLGTQFDSARLTFLRWIRFHMAGAMMTAVGIPTIMMLRWILQ